MTYTSMSKRRAQRGGVAPKRQAEIDAIPIPKRSKYRNVATTVDGIRFASKLELLRYGELKLRERGTDPRSQIRCLEVHPRFHLQVNDFDICDYVADFSYQEMDAGGEWNTVVEDTKGVLTPDCRIKLKLMKALLGIDVQVIRKARR